MFQSKNKAVALKYDTERENAPVVVASGCGEVAKRIIDVAEKNGIPVYRDDSAASLMCMLQVGSSIPPELYEVVAGIYVSLLRSSKELRDKMLKGVDV
ncbi:MAG: EscU/YscU/HrcU family type III secretion system export apparatus switch protein [Ruminococcus sp.]|nr:EscU/YscU/HrcU family type III secretion system export apparatus switch protein [Ruminococcus sp.]